MNDSDKTKEQLIQELTALRAASQRRLAQEQELAHINSILQTVNSTLNLDEVVEKVMDALKDIFCFNQISIGLFNSETNHLVATNWYGDGVTEELKHRFANYPLSIEWDDVYFIKAFLDNEAQYVSPITPKLLQQFSPRDRLMFHWNPHKSLIIIPLSVQGKVIGIINFVHTKEAFSLDDEQFARIQRYVAQIAVTINNAYLVRKTKFALEQTRTKEREIAHLNEVIQSTNASLDFDRIFDSILKGLKSIFTFDAIGIQLVSDDQAWLNIYKVYGDIIEPDQLQQWLAIPISATGKDSISSYVFATNELAYFPNVTADLPFSEVDWKIYAIHPFISYLAYPLIVQGQTIGVISFFCTQLALNLSEADVSRIQRYVTAISTAINNARNYEQLRLSNERLSLLLGQQGAAHRTDEGKVS